MLSRLISTLWSESLEPGSERICWERLDGRRRSSKRTLPVDTTTENSSPECSEVALDAMLSRAEEISIENGEEMRAAVWCKVIARVRQVMRKEEKKDNLDGIGLTRWLLCREVLLQMCNTHPLLKALKSQDGWSRLGCAELVRMVCTGDTISNFTAALTVQAMDIHRAFGSIVRSSGNQPSRLEFAACGALLEFSYALASGVAASSDETRNFGEQIETNEEPDSDDDENDENDESDQVPKRLPFMCLEALWKAKGEWAQSLQAERRWHGNTSHRAPFVLALDDLLAELGADALDDDGEFNKAGAAAAAARRCSPVVVACLGCDELESAALQADRDGDGFKAQRNRATAISARNAAKRRLAWLIRTAPPTEIRRNWNNTHSKSLAIEEALSEVVAQVGYLADDNFTSADESEDLRTKVSKEAICADIRRAVARRLCLLLGQIKSVRFEQLLGNKPELQGLLLSSLVALLRSSKITHMSESSSTSSNHRRALGALSFAKQSTAALASAALNRVLGSILNIGSKDSACATLLTLLDNENSQNDPASETVAALVGPIAANSLAVLRQLLQRLLKAAPGAIEAVAAALRVGSSSPEVERQVQSEICATIVTVLTSNHDEIFRAHVVDMLGPLANADHIVPKLCAALARANTKDRTILEQCLGACLMAANDAASALDLLASALRDSISEQVSATNKVVEDPARAFVQHQSHYQQEDEVRLALWVRRILDRTPDWLKTIAKNGGERWQRAVMAVARRIATSPKDAIVIRLWGAVADQFTIQDDTLSMRLCFIRILEQIEIHNTENRSDLFDRLAPLLALKRTPVQVWLKLEGEKDDLSGSSLNATDDSKKVPCGFEVMRRAAALLRHRALAIDENKAIATVAAECLGRLPPYFLDTSTAVQAYLADPDEETARIAKIEVFALCHAASVHGVLALGRGALNSLLTAIVQRDLPFLNQLQEGCVHALAMVIGAQAVEAAAIRKQAKNSDRQLVVEIADEEKSERKPPALSVAALLMHVACYDKDCKNTIELASAIISNENDAIAISNTIATRTTALRMACMSAIATAGAQLDVSSGALRLFADAIAYPALHAAGKILLSEHGEQDDIISAAAWLHVLFVLLVRLKESLCVPPVDLFGLALRGARHAQSSSVPIDVNLRRNGLKLLTGIIAIDDNIQRLPPSSTLQAMSTLHGLAQLEPNRELRQLAHQLTNALDTAINSSNAAFKRSSSQQQQYHQAVRLDRSTPLPEAYTAVSGIARTIPMAK